MRRSRARASRTPPLSPWPPSGSGRGENGHPAGAQDRCLAPPAAVDGPVRRGAPRRGFPGAQRVEADREPPAEDDGDAQALVVQAERSATAADLPLNEIRHGRQLLAPGRRLQHDEEPLEERAVERRGKRGGGGGAPDLRTRRRLARGQPQMRRQLLGAPDLAGMRPQRPAEQPSVPRLDHGRVLRRVHRRPHRPRRTARFEHLARQRDRHTDVGGDRRPARPRDGQLPVEPGPPRGVRQMALQRFDSTSAARVRTSSTTPLATASAPAKAPRTRSPARNTAGSTDPGGDPPRSPEPGGSS